MEKKVKQRKKPLPIALVILTDVVLTGIALCVFALFHHVLPQAISSDLSKVNVLSASVNSQGNSQVSAESTANSAASVKTSTDWSTKFSGKFTTGKVVMTDTTYMSQNVNVTVSRVQKNGITYYVEDIYIRSIENIKSAFADDTYGKSITQWPLEMATSNNAIAAINGDYYGTNNGGIVIRNGVLYRDSADGDVCVLFYDGTMKTYSKSEFNADEVIAAGAYQAWNFGPSLLSDGQAITQFGNSRISEKNPRCAIGYFEPGHYCFVVVDGRQSGYSVGMTLTEMSALFEELGCIEAYNLDGGQTASMVFGDNIVNQPYNGGRTCSDIIYICE